MMKKLFVCVLATCAISMFACSDDETYRAGDPCRYSDMAHNGTQCDGSVLQVCDINTGRIVETDCGAAGCTLDALGKNVCGGNGGGGNGGGGGSVSADCGSVTAAGRCEGNVAKKCVDGRLQMLTCENNSTCRQGADGTVDCFPNSSTVDKESCGDVTEIGICKDDKTLNYCGSDNKLVVETCTTKCITAMGDDNKPRYSKCKEECPAGLDIVGKCDGNKLMYCDGELGLINDDCSSTGMTCGEDVIKGQKLMSCVNKPCGDITAEGVCNDKVLKYCNENNQLVEKTCPIACGKTLDDNNHEIFDCLDKPVDESKTECGNITSDGVCDGKTLKYCQNDKLVTRNCDIACVSIATGGANKYSQCKAKCPENVPETGVCTQNKLQYCDKENGLVEVNCEAKNQICGDGTNDKGEAVKKCIDKAANPTNNCGNIDDKGICTGNVLKVCKNNTLETTDCALSQSECKQETGKAAACVKPQPDTEACGTVTADGVCDGNILKVCSNDKLVKTDCGTIGCVSMPASVENGAIAKRAQCKVACGSVTANGACLDKKIGFEYCDENLGLVNVTCAEGYECTEQNNAKPKCTKKGDVEIPTDPNKPVEM